MGEAGLAGGACRDGESCGGEDDGWIGVEEGAGEQGGDVDRRGLELSGKVRLRCSGKIACAAGGAALDPEDGVGVVGLEKELEVLTGVAGALGETLGFVNVLDEVELAFKTLEGVEGAEVGVAVGLEEGFAFGVVEGHAADGLGFHGQRGEEEAGAIPESGAGTFKGG